MVFEKLAEIMSEIIGYDYEDITPETELIISNGFDAISIARTIMECEKHFKITIHDEDVHTFKRADDIVKYIEALPSYSEPVLKSENDDDII